MDKSEIDKNALELKEDIRPLAAQALVQDGATGLEDKLDLLINNTKDPNIAKLSDARRGDSVESDRLKTEVKRVIGEVVEQIDFTLRDIEQSGQIYPGGVHLKKERVKAIKTLLKAKKDYFTQFLDETSRD